MIHQAKGYEVEITDATQWATVYDADGRPAGTLQRRRVYEKGPRWTAYGLDGSKLIASNNAAIALRQVVDRAERAKNN